MVRESQVERVHTAVLKSLKYTRPINLSLTQVLTATQLDIMATEKLLPQQPGNQQAHTALANKLQTPTVCRLLSLPFSSLVAGLQAV